MNDESFYNVAGAEIKKSDFVNIMIQQYLNNLEVGQTQLTDFNEGSEIRNLLESIACGLYFWAENDNQNVECGFISTASGDYLDMLGENPLLKIERDEGQEASGTVIFSIPEAIETDIVIPEGTVVAGSENGLDYSTNDECVIISGDTECSGFITCVSVGDEGNCNANTITIINAINVASNLKVTNPEAFTNGTNYEDDEIYRQRLLEASKTDTFGSLPYYTDLLENVDGVHDVYFADDPDFTKKIYVNGYSKPIPDEVLADCLVEISHAGNKVLNHNFLIAPPIYEVLDFNINLTVKETLEEEMLLSAVRAVFDGDGGRDFSAGGLYLGETLTRNMLTESLSVIDGVTKISIKLDGTSAEFEEIGCDFINVFKLGTVNFTQTVIN